MLKARRGRRRDLSAFFFGDGPFICTLPSPFSPAGFDAVFAQVFFSLFLGLGLPAFPVRRTTNSAIRFFFFPVLAGLFLGVTFTFPPSLQRSLFVLAQDGESPFFRPRTFCARDWFLMTCLLGWAGLGGLGSKESAPLPSPEPREVRDPSRHRRARPSSFPPLLYVVDSEAGRLFEVENLLFLALRFFPAPPWTGRHSPLCSPFRPPAFFLPPVKGKHRPEM